MLTTLKPTQLTKECCKLIIALLPTEPEQLSDVLGQVGGLLNTDIYDTIALTKRASNPGADPVFDDKHELALWYDNNIQMPRYLLALMDALHLEDCPDYIASQFPFDCSMVISEAQGLVNSYVKSQQSQCLSFG